MSLTKASFSMINGAVANVLDYGADPTGVADSTAAISACIAANSNVGVAGGGATIYFPKGTYLCNVAINGTVNNSVGEYGVCFSGYGATLKGRSTDTSIITINGAVANVADPAPSNNIFANGLRIEGFTLDMSNMANSAASYAFAGQHTYSSTVADIAVINEPSLGGGFFLGSETYTYSVENLNCERVNIQGYNNSSNLTSTHAFYGLDASQVLLTNVFSLTFIGGAMQGGLDHFVFDNAQSIVISGVDFERTLGTGYMYNFGSNVRYITSFNNNTAGYDLNSYSTGIAYNSLLEDRPSITSSLPNNIGIYGRTASQGKVAVSTSSTAIYYFLDTQSGQNFGLFLISADNGFNGFQDLIMVGLTVVTTLSSTTLYGSPPARTYAVSGNQLNMSVASGSYDVRPVVMEFLMSTA